MRLRKELRHIFPSDAAKPVFNVALCLRLAKRPDMAGGNDPLAKLFHFRSLQGFAKLRLSDQKTLK